MVESSKQLGLAGIGLVAAGALAGDYFLNGPHSIVGKILGGDKKRGFSHMRPSSRIPSDPLYGRNRFGEPADTEFVVPVKTARAPFPDLIPDASGRVLIPADYNNYTPRGRHGASGEDMQVAAEEIANLVFQDASFFSPSEKWNVGTSVEIKRKILKILHSPNPPEIFIRLVQFHARHGREARNRGSPLYQQQIKLAGSCADLYEDALGLEKWFSREGNAYAAEYDKQDDRLAAKGAHSPIFFGIAGAYYLQ